MSINKLIREDLVLEFVIFQLLLIKKSLKSRVIYTFGNIKELMLFISSKAAGLLFNGLMVFFLISPAYQRHSLKHTSMYHHEIF